MEQRILYEKIHEQIPVDLRIRDGFEIKKTL